MAIVPVPAKFGFSRVNDFKLQRATNILRSKYTGQGQRIRYPFAVWMLDATLVETDGLDAGRVRSFLVQLEGQSNSFRLQVPGYWRPSTGYPGDAVVTGEYAARASTLLISGLTPSVGILRDGDYFTINDELKMVTADIASSVNGQATISFKPPLRKGVVSMTKVTLQKPTLLMTAQEDDVASWGIGPPTRQSGKFLAVEALDI